MSLADLPPLFSCPVEPDRDRVVVRPSGELDLTSVEVVDRELRELVAAGFDHLVVDLRGVTFMDSSGLALLLRWTRSARADGISLEVHPGGRDVMRVVDLAGVRDVLPLVARRRFDRS